MSSALACQGASLSTKRPRNFSPRRGNRTQPRATPWVVNGQSNHRPEGAKELIMNAFAPSGRGMLGARIIPGRCPGLRSSAPSGRANDRSLGYPQGASLGCVLLPLRGVGWNVPRIPAGRQPGLRSVAPSGRSSLVQLKTPET